MLKRTRFRGHIDRIADGYLFGWLTDSHHPNRSVVFELFVNDIYWGQCTCAYFRPDLMAVGVGNGIHGFKVCLPDSSITHSDRVEMFVPSAGATWLIAINGQLREQRGLGATRTLRIRRFRSKLLASGAAPSDRPANASDASWTVGILSKANVYGKVRSSSIQSSDFTEFLRRLKHWNVDDDQFYSWYINEYIYNLDPRFIPLSNDEKDFIRLLIERTRAEIGLPPLARYLRIVSWKGFATIKASYRPYWWAIEGGRQLKLDQSILTEREAKILHEYANIGFGKAFPLTYFMLIFALRHGLVAPLAMLFPSGRRRVYEWCFEYARRNSHIRKHVECVVFPILSRQPLTALPERHTRVIGAINKDSTRTLAKGDPRVGEECEVREPYPLQLIGPFDKVLGLGESSRRIMTAVQQVEPTCRFVCYNEGIQSASLDAIYNFEVSRSLINIIHINIEQIPEFFLKNGDVLKDSYNIIFPYWELNKLSSLHHLGMELVDEVWTASSFIASLFATHRWPVVTIGLPASKLSRVQFSDRADGKFIFLTSFDAFSWPQRKNALAVVKAFRAAFDITEDVRLIIKTQNADRVHTTHQKQAWLELKERSSEDSRIEIINETYTPERQRELLCSADCLVSLHRSEGLGIDLLDALATGIPIVATAYSGNMDVCTKQNSWLVDYDLVPVKLDEYVFVEEGHVWADPVHSKAVDSLRDVYTKRTSRIEKAISGIADAERLRSMETVSKRIEDRLNILRSSNGFAT